MQNHGQVGIVSDHFWGQPRLNKWSAEKLFMLRVRHCVECPSCHTRYLVSFSPYRNGSYLIPTVAGSLEEYSLYCACSRGVTVWRWSEVKTCEVSPMAYERGYGTVDEIVPLNQSNEPWAFDAAKYLDGWHSMEKRRDPR